MRWITAVVLTCLLVSTPAFAVVSSVVTHTFQSAAAATGNGTALDVSKYNSLAVQIVSTSGTFTVTFEGSIDNSNWISLTGTSIASTSATLVTSATAAGVYQFNTSGLSSVRMRISACSSCIGVTVSGVLTTAVASKKGGGSGSGAPTDSTYITQTADGTLSAEQALGSLATGCLGSTTTTGVVASRTITGTANEITVTNGNCSGNPTLSLPSALDLGGKTVEIPNSTTLPATCNVGEMYMDTDATTGQRFYLCQSANTWVLQGDGGGGVSDALSLTCTGCTDGHVLFSSSGVVVEGTVDAIPSGTTVWTGSACSGCSAEHSLSGITGIVKSTTGTPSAATAGTDYTTPSSTESFTNKTIDCNATGMTCSNFPGGTSSPVPTKVFLIEEFCGGTVSPGFIGQLGWTSGGSGTVAKEAGSSPNLCQYSMTSGASSGNFEFFTLHDYGGNGYALLGGHTAGNTTPWEANFVFKCSSTASITCIVGLVNNSTNVIVPVDYIGIRYDTNASDTNFMFVCAKNGAGTTAVDTTIAADTGFHRLKVYSNAANDIRYILYGSAGSIEKDGSAANQCSTSANIPTADLTLQFLVGTRTGATKKVTADYASYTKTVGR